ncbi:phosphoesterase RecJ domain protein [Clostridium sp. CAG:440]|jgi:phosphoesterase recJ domain protein|nr:phosphoesterase RecJ domain protein [Clostridium sp. CAG:440]
MQNTNRKVFDNLVSRTKIYLVIIFLLLLFISIQFNNLILPSILIFAAIIGYTYFANNKRKSEISETLQDLTLTVDSTAKSSLINSPFPLLILETNGNIVWKSSSFVTEFQHIDVNDYIDELVYDIKAQIENEKQVNKDKTIQKQIKIDKKIYRVYGKFVNSRNKEKKNKKEYMMVLYFLDETEKCKLQEEYENSKTCIGMIMVDNYEETFQLLESEEVAQCKAEIDKYIYEWINKWDGVLVKSERDRYICFFEQRHLKAIKEDKFSILDKIKEIDLKSKVQLTLSIAISNEGATQKDKYKSVTTAMDIVLGRGGDQAVIRENDIYKFFGGRTQEVERRTKVKARVVAHALENLIQESSKVLIMGHTNPDIDALGSAMGMYRFVKNMNKNGYIIDSENAAALDSFKEVLAKEEEYEDVLISKEVALENIDEDTLLIVVDTHKKNYVESEEILEKCPKVVIIDHHRRSADFIENATLMFQEVYASSAAELVTELLQYATQKVDLKTIEAESLYAGIMMDTKNFTFKTGVRTFEAAAYLRRCGVDIIRVKKWFQSDLESFNKIADIVKRAEIVNDTIAISINKEKTKDASIVCAKAADELLTISDITASFVLGYMEDKRICISGRSIGDINVQVILEKLRRRRTYYPCRSTSRRNDNGRSKTRTNNKNK